MAQTDVNHHESMRRTAHAVAQIIRQAVALGVAPLESHPAAGGVVPARGRQTIAEICIYESSINYLQVR